MAYQNVGKPRIYLNVAEYLAVNGVMDIDPIYMTLPVTPRLQTNTQIPDIWNEGVYIDANNKYAAFLGHSDKIFLTIGGSEESQSATIIAGDEEDGNFSIYTFAGDLNYASGSGGDYAEIGSIVMGFFYDFPVSPDLNLSLSYEYDGVTEITTKGGSTLTNANYIKPAMWGNRGSWEFKGSNQKLSRSGRRVWNISFSYMSDDEVFPKNYALQNNTGNSDLNTLLNINTLQKVIHVTNGGQLPFIFQPDSTNNQVFAIAKFDTKSFQFNQTSLNTYTVKMTIKEIW